MCSVRADEAIPYSGYRCDPSVTGTTLSSTPSDFTSGVVSIPDSVSVWLAAGIGSVPVTASVQLSGTDLTNPKIDVIVLTDFFVDSTTTGQRASIDSAWTNFGDLAGLSLDLKVAIVNFLPTSNAVDANYTLRSDYTFSGVALGMNNAAYHRIDCGSTAGARLKRGQNLINAINDIATSRALNWRSDSYHVVWVHTLCPLPADASSSTSGVNLKTIQQTTGIVPVIANGQQPQSSSLSFTSNIPYNYTTYYSGINAPWDSPFRSSNLTQTEAFPAYRGVSLFSELVKTVQVVASQGDTSWLMNIPTTYTTLSSSGLATIAYNLAWPATVPSSPVNSSFRTSVQILGRDTISYLIYFNRPPTLAPFLGTIDVTSTSLTFVMAPSDIGQGYLLALQIDSLPTMGTLTALNGTSLLSGSTLAYGSYTMIYTPSTSSRVVDYIDTFNVRVSDGCKTSTSSVSISVSRINRAPSASNVTVTMSEDAIVSGSFSLTMNDPDGDSLTAILSSPAFVSAGSVSVGNLGAGSSSSTTYYTSGTVPSGDLYYHLIATNTLTGFGTIKIPYRAFDGSHYSPIAYIIVTVLHVNHPPTISVSTSIVNKVSQSIAFSVYVSDADYAFSGESATLQIISTSSWGTGSPASDVAYIITNTGTNTYSFNGASIPFIFSDTTTYAAPGTGVVRAGNMLIFTGMSWTAPNTAPTKNSQTLTIQITDASGGTGTATVTFSLTNTNRPEWQQTPGLVSPSNDQGSTWDDIYFSMYDPDGSSDMAGAIYTVVSAPANGQAFLQSSDGVTSASALITGSTFKTTDTPAYATYNAVDNVGDFRIRYVGNADYFGYDSIVISVVDSTGLPAGNAFAMFTLTRIPTPPVSSNFSIVGGYEQSVISFGIVGQSTNNVASRVNFFLKSLSFAGTFKQYEDSDLVDWTVQSLSNPTSNAGPLAGILKGNLGIYSSPSTTPAGFFTYRVYEPSTDLYSVATYTASIFITHVNHAPASSNMNSSIVRSELLTVKLPAIDVDADGTDDQLNATILSVSPYNGGPTLYYDSDLTIPVDAASIASGKRLTDRTFYYKSSTIYDAAVPLMTYQFQIYDQYNASSAVYSGTITVTASNSLPQVPTTVTETQQEMPVPIQLSVGVVTESGQPPTVQITSLPNRGTFSYCDDTGICMVFGSSPTLPFTLPSTKGRVIFVPRDNDYGNSFTSFTYTLTDPGTGIVGSYTMTINVLRAVPDTPTSGTPVAAGCPQNTRPSADFVCINGVWTAPSTVSTPTLNIPSGAGTVFVVGNLSSPSVVIHGIGSTIVVNGSVGALTTITIEFDSNQASNLGGQKVLQILVNTSGSSSPSDLSLVNVNTKVTSGCRKVKAEKVTFDGGKTLGAYMSVDSSGCNTWWIILVSVVVAVIVVAAVVLVLLAVFYKPFRLKIRPYSGSAARSRALVQ